jgi:hypothetical protein
MGTFFKFAFTALVLSPLAVVGNATAQTLGSPVSVQPDVLCDYCKDFTDAATAVGPVRSAYRPGTGYAEEQEKNVAPIQSHVQQVPELRVVQDHSTTKPR